MSTTLKLNGGSWYLVSRGDWLRIGHVCNGKFRTVNFMNDISSCAYCKSKMTEGQKFMTNAMILDEYAARTDSLIFIGTPAGAAYSDIIDAALYTQVVEL